MKVIEWSHLSSEPIRVPVYAENNGAVFPPTGMTVEMAFVNATTGGDPSVWTAGLWDVDSAHGVTVYRAQVKPPVLAVGTYNIYLRLTGTDIPVRMVGILKLT